MRLVLLMDQEPINCSGAKPHEPTSNSSPRTRIRITGVIQDVPLRTYRMLNSSQSYRVPNASAGIFHHVVNVDNRWQSAFGCEYHDGSWGLTFMTLYESQHSEFYRGGRVLRIYCRVPCLANAIAEFIGFFIMFVTCSRWE